MMGAEEIAAYEAAAPYIFGAGTAASMYGSEVKAKQQRQIINQAFAKTDETQKKGIDKALTTAADMSGQSRLAQMQQAESANFDRTQGDLKGAGADLIDTSEPQDANVSADFLKAKADAATSEGTRMTAMARELAKVRSAGDVQTAQRMKQANLAEELGSMWSGTRADTQAAQMDANSVGEPGIGQLGRIAQLVGGVGMAAGAGAGAGAGSTVATTATNPALIDSAVGTAGYGASSATPAASSVPIWGAQPKKTAALWWMQRQR